jgi:3-hydroxy-9,10-secoandrosta-1,3,5(10)-triene-9,17-dione monooxygenase reductase component
MKTSTTYPRIRRTGRFAVNVLSSHQQGISNQFARRATDKWAGIDWHPTRAGTPVLEDTLMWLDCEIWAEHDAGDHVIVLGRVTEMSPAIRQAYEPLLYFQGRYRHLGPDGTP